MFFIKKLKFYFIIEDPVEEVTSSIFFFFFLINFNLSTVSVLDLRLPQNLFLRDQTPMPRPTTRTHPAATGTSVIAMSCEGGAAEGETFELNAGPSTSFTWTFSSVTVLTVLTVPPPTLSLSLGFIFSISSFVVSG